MRFSIQLIFDRLEIITRNRMLIGACEDKFSQLMIYDKGETLCDNCVYVTDVFPSNIAETNKKVAFVIITEPENFSATVDIAKTTEKSCLIYSTENSLINMYNRISHMLSKLDEEIQKIQNFAYTSENLDELITMLYDVFQNPAYLVDSSFKVTAIDRTRGMRELSATWKHLEDDGYLSFDIVSSLISSGELGDMETKKDASHVVSQHFYTKFINYNLRHKGKLQGHLFIVGQKRRLHTSDAELVNLLGECVMFAVLKNSNFQNYRGNYYEYFMRDMFSGKLSEPLRIKEQMSHLNFSPNDYYTVVIFNPALDSGLSDERIASQLERCSGIKPVFYKGTITALFSNKTRLTNDEMRAKLYDVWQSLGCEIGVSDTVRGYYHLNISHTQAEWALKSCTETDGTKGGRMRFYSDHATEHLVKQFCKNLSWEVGVMPELIALQSDEATLSLDPLTTLFVYLNCERSLKTASKVLNIHRNTLVYRIQKITNHCGFDLDDIQLRERILLSLLIIKYK